MRASDLFAKVERSDGWSTCELGFRRLQMSTYLGLLLCRGYIEIEEYLCRSWAAKNRKMCAGSES